METGIEFEAQNVHSQSGEDYWRRCVEPFHGITLGGGEDWERQKKISFALSILFSNKGKGIQLKELNRLAIISFLASAGARPISVTAGEVGGTLPYIKTECFDLGWDHHLTVPSPNDK
ncbi:hypothetical protein AVEN_52038-1 [Araneus ventricosus]|uniref:Uncharacterized protein n=1 Tax=Araneus ventricosus TaxID=182803 RepID=A0A4Y2CEL5_ARAVE|nr:hypothetical protein AVEN_52038-1 [Araneus ventricosus]